MKTPIQQLAAIALATASAALLSACGQGPQVGTGIGPVGPGVGGAPVCLQGVTPQTGFGGIGGMGQMNISFMVQGANYNPMNQSVSAGQIPGFAGQTFTAPGGQPGGFGQVLLQGMGGVGGAPLPVAAPVGGVGGLVSVQGFDARYGAVQMQLQSNVPCNNQQQPGGWGMPTMGTCDLRGLPLQPAQMSGQGMLQLNAIALQDIYNLAMQLQFGNQFQGYYPIQNQPYYWPQNQPGVVQPGLAQPGAPAQVCITAAAFYTAIAAGTSNMLAYGDVYLYVNNTQRGIRMILR